MSDLPTSSRRSRLPLGLLITLGVLAVGGALAWRYFPKQVDWEQVYQTNNRGAAQMEMFQYGDALATFEKVVRLAPEWRPGRINMGIALLNKGGKDGALEDKQRAIALFQDLLSSQKDDPYANFCLGLLYQDAGNLDAAKAHFEAVLRKDPNDANTMCLLAQLVPDQPEKAKEYYERAYARQPGLTSAVYGMSQVYFRQGKRKQAEELQARHQMLNRSGAGIPQSPKYTETGQYAEVIGAWSEARAPRTGPLPLFDYKPLEVKLAADCRWATAADLGDDPVGKVRARVRARFGATITVLDYDQDGKPDLFLAGAVVENGKVHDLLLHNEGGDRFKDVTKEAGLARPHPTLGACAADYDNDGRADLLLTGVGSQRLFRNRGDGTFADVTDKAGLDKITSVCLGAAFVDLDQDADLDVLLCSYAASAEEALEALDGKHKGKGGLVVLLNTGNALPAAFDTNAALTTAFVRSDALGVTLKGLESPVGVVVSDLDRDGDLDLVALGDRSVLPVVINDRLLSFRRGDVPEALAPRANWNGALVLDVDHDGRSDLVLVGDRAPKLLMGRATPGEGDVTKWFEDGPSNAPKLLQAVAGDLDLDSWTDVVGLSEDRKLVLLHNEGGKLAVARDGLGTPDLWPKDLIAVTVCALDGGRFLDVVGWSESKGLIAARNKGNDNHGLLLLPVGGNYKQTKDGHQLHSNADGVGVWAIAQAGDVWAGQENTVFSAGLGQSRQPLTLGLGAFPTATAVRLRWPDGCWQAEMDQEADRVVRITENNRKPTSCPVLFTWDGERFVFVTDFLGAGSVGEQGPDGSCRPPRAEESVKIEPHQLRPRDGSFVLRIAEPMDEVSYLDRLQLVTIDHPAGTQVFPDERFAATGPPPSQSIVAFDREVFPVAARDHNGQELGDKLHRRDRVTADGFRKRAWPGFAEDHWTEFDFSDRLSRFGPSERLYLCLAGWTDYATPASIWAAHQAGVEVRVPILERQDERGQWQAVCEAGFPAGLPKVMLLDVTGKLCGASCRLRLRTNLCVYWDQVFIAAGCRVAPVAAKDGVRATALEVSSAELGPCGLFQEYSPDGREPTIYAHDRFDRVPVNPPAGMRTCFGDVTELLTSKDDRFVVFGPGDAVTVRFDARSLPSLPEGWKRSFVLRSWGYCKDSSPFTARGATIEPLPFAGMRTYPPGPDERYPQDVLHNDYLHRYQTREVRSEPARGWRR